MPGMLWLAEPAYESAPTCLTFVRGDGGQYRLGQRGALRCS
jgi:hypothetical protein